MGKNNMNKEDKEENVAGFITEGDLALWSTSRSQNLFETQER